MTDTPYRDDTTISYIEMRNRVERAMFGEILSLTHDERFDWEAGLRQAASALAHNLADVKVRKIQWRHDRVDTWLAENGLIDPFQRQFGLESPPTSRKRFEAAFVPVFGDGPSAISGHSVEADEVLGATDVLQHQPSEAQVVLPLQPRGRRRTESNAATKRLKDMLRKKTISIQEYLGLTKVEQAEMLQVSRPTADKAMIEVLSDPEFQHLKKFLVANNN